MKRIRIGRDDDGAVVRLAAGDRVVLELPENPTTGFRWSVDDLQGPISIASDTYAPAADAAIGSSCVRTFEVASEGAGSASLRLKRWQEWEGPSSIDAWFSCSFLVSD